MAGFGDLPTGDTTTFQPQQTAQKGGGGIGGFLFNHLIKPTATTLVDLPQDLYHSTKAAGMAIGNVATGNKSTNAKQSVINEIQKSPGFGNYFQGETAANSKDANIGKQLEQIAGKTGSNIANVAAVSPVGSAKSLGVLGSAKLAGKIGALQGASGAAEQGENGGAVTNAALEGGAIGAGLGLGGGLFGKLAGRGGPVPEVSTPGKLNVVGKMARKGGAAPVNAATSERAQQLQSLLQPFVGVDQKTLEGSGGGGLKGALETMQNFKMEPTVENMHTAADLTTGGSGALSSTLREILNQGDVGKVSLDGVVDSATNALKSEAVGDPLARGTDANKIVSQVRNIVSSKSEARAGGISSPDNAFTTIQNLEKAMRNTGNDEKGQAARRALGAAKTSLEDQLYGVSGLDKAVSNYKLDPQLEEDLRTDISGRGGSRELADHIVNSINESQTGHDLRSAQAPLVNVGQLAHAATRYGQGKGVIKGVDNAVKTAEEAVGSTKANPFSGLGTTYEGASALRGNPIAMAELAVKGAKSGPLQRLATKVSPKQAQAGAAEAQTTGNDLLGSLPGVEPSELPQPVAPTPKRTGVTSRLTRRAAPVATTLAANAGGNLASNLNVPQSADQTTTNPENAPIDLGTPTDTTDQSDSVFTPEVLQAMAIQDIQQTGGANLAKIAQLSTLFGNKQNSTNTIKPTSQQYGEAQSGLASLNSLAQMIQADPEIVNKTAVPGQNNRIFGGLVKRVEGTSDYQSAAQNTLDALARARTGAAMSKQEQAFYQRFLPTAGDSPEAIQYKLQQLAQAFQPFLNTQSISGNQ